MTNMDNNNVHLVLFDSADNGSVVLYGNIKIKETKTINDTGEGNLSGSRGFVYDQQGVRWYVVSVMVVYSLSMVFLVITLVRRKGKYRNMDSEVSKFMKGLENARQQAREDEVRRMRLRWPGNFIGLRFDARHGGNIPPSDVENFPEWPCLHDGDKTKSDDDAKSESSDSSYMIIPATTVKRDTEAPLTRAKDVEQDGNISQLTGENRYDRDDFDTFMISQDTGMADHSDIHHDITLVRHNPGELSSDIKRKSLQTLEVDYPKDYKPRDRPGRRRPIIQIHDYENNKNNVIEGTKSDNIAELPVVDARTDQDTNISDQTVCSVNIPDCTLRDRKYSEDVLGARVTEHSKYINSYETYPCRTAYCNAITDSYYSADLEAQLDGLDGVEVFYDDSETEV